ncbi:serine hydrolase [Sphingobacteriaceae bacterium GW460-11-11-14-LB5]|nr:serine hydrolase [Sphingobacteriaceae bacterium GW460-11-11-14-LB5]
MKKNILILIIISFFLSKVSYGQSSLSKKINDYITYIDTNHRAVGSLSIFKDGEEIYNRSFGQTSLKKVSYNANTKYQIGSITKLITATLIFKLIEKGELDLEDKLAVYYPQIPNASKISIKNLLEHSSGLGDFLMKKDSIFWLIKKVSEQDIMNEIIRQGVSFQPNEKVAYSNTGYYLLTKILEKKHKQPYAKIVDEEIAKPLKLKNFSAYTPKTTNVFQSYNYINQWNIIEDLNFSNVTGAGDISSTTQDLNVFITSLFQYKILKKETIELMKPKHETFGRGIMPIPFYESMYYGHAGDTYGTHSIVGYNENDRISWALALNAARFDKNDFAIVLLSIIYNKPYELPNFKPYLNVKTNDLDKYLGVYASPDFPLKITVSKNGNILKAQATGQTDFPLDCYEVDKFTSAQYKLTIEFLPSEHRIIFSQGKNRITMDKE